MRSQKLRSIPGQRVRWQYFSSFLYMMFLVCPMVLTATTTMALNDPEYGMQKWLTETGEGILTVLILVFSLIILCVLNRFFIGKIICVLNAEGLHHNGGLVCWSSIESVTYIIEPPVSHHDYCRAHIVGTDVDIELIHAPLFLLWKLKKYIPEAKMKLSRGSIVTVCVASILPAIIVTAVMLFS